MISRYNRQDLVIGKKAQQTLLKSTAVIVGMGALGTVAAEILARAGIGKIVLVDRDIVELTDLQRQLLYDEGDVEKPKASVAAEKIRKINSSILVAAAANDIDHRNIAAIVGKPDILLDCTDNLETRFLVNEYCLKNRLAWVHAAAIRETGQLAAFDFRTSNKAPCYACIFGKSSAEGTCDTVGVLAAATATIAALQANEAIKLLIGETGEVKLLRLNVRNNELIKLAARKNPRCRSCKGNHEYLAGKKSVATVSMCGKNLFQVKGKEVDLKHLKLRLQRTGESIADFGECISFRNITLFRDGRALVKSETMEKAKSAYARLIGA